MVAGARHFDERGRLRHHDGRRDAEPLGVIGEGLARDCRPTSRSHRACAHRPRASRSLLAAPRSLKDEVNCRLSSFSQMSAPVMRDSVSERTNGERVTEPAMRLCGLADVGEGDSGFVGHGPAHVSRFGGARHSECLVLDALPT